MQGIAIVTKFMGPTNHRGSRVKALLPSGDSVTIPWDHALDANDNHRRVAARAMRKVIDRSYSTYAQSLKPLIHLTRDLPGGKGAMVHIVHYCANYEAVEY